MSRPKVRTTEADELIHDEALHRIERRSDKQLAQVLAEKGIAMSPGHVGNLVRAERRRILKQQKLSAFSHVMPAPAEIVKSSGTIG